MHGNDTQETAGLKAEVGALKQRLAELEAQLRYVQAQLAAALAAKAQPWPQYNPPPPAWLEPFQLPPSPALPLAPLQPRHWPTVICNHTVAADQFRVDLRDASVGPQQPVLYVSP